MRIQPLFKNPPYPSAFSEPLRVMSFNIRSDDDPEHSWSLRKGLVSSVIHFHQPDIIGFQEPDFHQLKDLVELLNEHSIFSGSCLKDRECGCYDPIFYRKDLFTLLDSGFFYLSEFPKEISKGWDAKFPRGASWVKLYRKKEEDAFYVFNTHFDYHGKIARDESAYLLREKITEIAKEEPFIVTGDFNLFPKLGGKKTYQILTEKTPFQKTKSLIDAQTVSLRPHHGPTGSWSGFKEAGQPGIKPDFIFVDEKVSVLLHGILSDSFDGVFPSDHLPVIADIQLPS